MHIGIALLLFSLLTARDVLIDLPTDRPQILGKIVWFGDSTESPVIEVIALLDSGKLKDVETYYKTDFTATPLELHTDSALSFYHKHMKGRMFHLSINGSEVGTARTLRPHIDSVLSDCLVGAYANAQYTKLVKGQEFLVTTWQPKTLYGYPKEAAVDQQRLALHRGKTLLIANGLPSNLESSLTVGQCRLLNDGKLTANLVQAYDSVNFAPYSIFFISDVRSGKEQFIAFNTGTEAEALVTEYIAQIDIDGDGIDEILLQNYYSEWLDYTILKWQNDRWTSIFQGGGNGI